MKIITGSLYIIFLLLNIFDIYSTNILLQNGCQELNPFMNLAINHLGILKGLIIVKGVVFLFLLYLTIIVYKRKIKKEILYINIVLFASNLFYLCGMYHFNYKELLLLN